MQEVRDMEVGKLSKCSPEEPILGRPVLTATGRRGPGPGGVLAGLRRAAVWRRILRDAYISFIQVKPSSFCGLRRVGKIGRRIVAVHSRWVAPGARGGARRVVGTGNGAWDPC